MNQHDFFVSMPGMIALLRISVRFLVISTNTSVNLIIHQIMGATPEYEKQACYSRGWQTSEFGCKTG
ncbi:MAG: hypothetical protein ABFS24_05345 [Pseudomonadota bacterium]